MPREPVHTYVCESCGNEASLTIKEEETSLEEHRVKPVPKKRTLVCKVCDNEANMILEEI